MPREMTITHKVVLNTNYGGFKLTTEAARMLAERKGLPFIDLTAEMGENHYAFGPEYEALDQVCSRDDPDLIAVVTALGPKASERGDVVVKDVRINLDVEDRYGFESVHVWEG